ncbi:hypothetical protein UFOVP87_12 [uncultured Caudovirales phage]|uniref:Uncharacterized protein n=1 Tax=uncultured Caudovirales phage TaxID=2100421 RepID=A0A6J5KZJ8_9CAUD|nr:hypothetical protein UFOVP87_12 [uncultured Caudovirales phage]
MSPELRKELALAEASKYFQGVNAAKNKVVVVMPFEAAWVDPTDEAMDAINDFAADRKGSVHEFKVPKVAELEESSEELDEPKAKETKSKK